MLVSDRYGRSFRKLRISLLDACNYSCSYCMPDNRSFSCHEQLMSADQISNIVSNLVNYGVEEIRLTGGEPLLRHDFLDIVKKLSEQRVKRIGLTTNGHHLFKLLPELKKTRLTSINISLDSLQRDKFRKITNVDGLERVLSAILMAKELGFEVKINCVVMKTINDNEVFDFVEFSKQNQIEVRFLEVMKIGVMVSQFDKYFISNKNLLNNLKMNYRCQQIQTSFDSTSSRYHIDSDAIIGFISSESSPFCSGCSRLRLNAKGHLRSCLMIPDGVDVKNLSSEDYQDMLDGLLKQKPINRINEISQPMYQIGG